MHALAFIAAALGFAVASPISVRDQNAPNVVASVDRWTGPGCSGTICNTAGQGDLVPGCNPILDGCTASLSLNYANKGCTVTVFEDAGCPGVAPLTLTTWGVCSALQTSFKSIHVAC